MSADTHTVRAVASDPAPLQWGALYANVGATCRGGKGGPGSDVFTLRLSCQIQGSPGHRNPLFRDRSRCSVTVPTPPRPAHSALTPGFPVYPWPVAPHRGSDCLRIQMRTQGSGAVLAQGRAADRGRALSPGVTSSGHRGPPAGVCHCPEVSQPPHFSAQRPRGLPPLQALPHPGWEPAWCQSPRGPFCGHMTGWGLGSHRRLRAPR